MDRVDAKTVDRVLEEWLTSILVARDAGPELVSKLVLVDVVPRFEQQGGTRIADFLQNIVSGKIRMST